MMQGRGRTGTGVSVALALALAALVTPAPLGAHDGNSDPNAIHGCAGPNGQLRVVGVAGTCTGSETAVHWGATCSRTSSARRRRKPRPMPASTGRA